MDRNSLNLYRLSALSRSIGTIDTCQEKVDYATKHRRNSQYHWKQWIKYVGESDASELEYCLLNPSTRTIKQLIVEDVQMTDKMFNDLYGKDVEPRVEFLLKHAEEARID